MSESTPEPGDAAPAWATALQAKVESLAATVAGLVPTSHAQAQQRTEDRLDRPSTIGDAVAREVARLDRERKQDEERAASARHRTESEARIRRLEQRETVPAGGRGGAAAGSGDGAPDWRANLWG